MGRRGGIKRLLQRGAPDLFAKYSTIMRYKAMAKRFRQACGAGEPIPPATLLPAQGTAGPSGHVPSPGPATADPALMSESAPAAIAEEMRKGLDRAREIARAILGECEGTLISLEAALALRLDPDCIPVKEEAYARKPGRLRIPKRGVAWLARRRVA